MLCFTLMACILSALVTNSVRILLVVEWLCNNDYPASYNNVCHTVYSGKFLQVETWELECMLAACPTVPENVMLKNSSKDMAEYEKSF